LVAGKEAADAVATDVLPRSDAQIRIGEFQHAGTEIRILALGTVLTNATKGRLKLEEITILNNSGIALQDLYVAEAIIQALAS